MVSDRVPQEVMLTENISSLPIDGTGAVKLWADKLLAVEPMNNAERTNEWMTVRDAGYDLKDLAQYIPMLYD